VISYDTDARLHRSACFSARRLAEESSRGPRVKSPRTRDALETEDRSGAGEPNKYLTLLVFHRRPAAGPSDQSCPNALLVVTTRAAVQNGGELSCRLKVLIMSHVPVIEFFLRCARHGSGDQ
jgi:hypothetical protein